MKKGIAIFDLTDTLINTSDVWSTAWDSLLDELSINKHEFKSKILCEMDATRALESLMDIHRVPYTHTELAIKLGRYSIGDFNKGAKLMPGAIEGVKAMHDNGYLVVAIANTNPILSELAKKKFSEILNIDKWYNTRELGISKDNEALYLKIAKDLDAEESDCTLIDNSEPVIKAVSRMGIKTIFVSDKTLAEADRNISSLFELQLKKTHKTPTRKFVFTENLLF